MTLVCGKITDLQIRWYRAHKKCKKKVQKQGARFYCPKCRTYVSPRETKMTLFLVLTINNVQRVAIFDKRIITHILRKAGTSTTKVSKRLKGLRGQEWASMVEKIKNEVMTAYRRATFWLVCLDVDRFGVGQKWIPIERAPPELVAKYVSAVYVPASQMNDLVLSIVEREFGEGIHIRQEAKMQGNNCLLRYLWKLDAEKEAELRVWLGITHKRAILIQARINAQDKSILVAPLEPSGEKRKIWWYRHLHLESWRSNVRESLEECMKLIKEAKKKMDTIRNYEELDVRKQKEEHREAEKFHKLLLSGAGTEEIMRELENIEL